MKFWQAAGSCVHMAAFWRAVWRTDFSVRTYTVAAAQAVFYTRRYWRGDRLFLRVLVCSVHDLKHHCVFSCDVVRQVPVAVCLEVLHFILFCMSGLFSLFRDPYFRSSSCALVVYDITVTSRYFVGFRELPWYVSSTPAHT